MISWRIEEVNSMVKPYQTLIKRIVGYFNLNTGQSELSKPEIELKISDLEAEIKKSEAQRAGWSLGRKIISYIDLNYHTPRQLRHQLSYYQKQIQEYH